MFIVPFFVLMIHKNTAKVRKISIKQHKNRLLRTFFHEKHHFFLFFV